MKNLLTGERIRPPSTPPGGKRKLTYPPALGITPEQQKQARQRLISRRKAAQQSVQRIGLWARISKWLGAIAHR